MHRYCNTSLHPKPIHFTYYASLTQRPTRCTQRDHQANLDRLSNKENLHSQIEQLNNIVEAKKQHAIQLSTNSLKLREKMHSYQISQEMADSRTANALSLYAKISNITWNYKAPVGHLAGCT